MQATVRGTRAFLKSLTAAAAVAGVLALATPASAQQITSAEHLALSTRMLQTELMVAALTCDAHARYDAFVHKFQHQLVVRGRALRAMFEHYFGAAGNHRLTSFVTKLANEAALRSAQAGPGYCGHAEHLFDTTLAVSRKDFPAFVAHQPFADAHGIEDVLNSAVQRIADSMATDTAQDVAAVNR